MARFLRDWQTQGGPPAEILIEHDGAHLDISIGDSRQLPSVEAGDLTDAELAREVIDHLHAEVVSYEGQQGRPLLPFCPTHGSSLHAQAVRSSVLWWCGTGAHHPAVIGEL